jgi:hypothetical protein
LLEVVVGTTIFASNEIVLVGNVTRAYISPQDEVVPPVVFSSPETTDQYPEDGVNVQPVVLPSAKSSEKRTAAWAGSLRARSDKAMRKIAVKKIDLGRLNFKIVKLFIFSLSN